LERQSGSRTEINHISARRSEHKSITINTKEGDTVTLSFAQKSEADYLSYQHLGYQKARAWGDPGSIGQWTETRSSATQLSLGYSRELSISIEGDLSPEELEDITQAVRAVDDMLQGVLYGEGGDPDAASLSELDLDTLSGLTADYGYSQEVRVRRLNHEAQRYSRQGALNAPGHHGGRFAQRMHQLLAPAMEQLAAAKTEPRKLAGPLGQLFQGYYQRLDPADFQHDARQSLLEMIRETLFAGLDARFEDSL
jgi:hypothetical protein